MTLNLIIVNILFRCRLISTLAGINERTSYKSESRNQNLDILRIITHFRF